MDYNLLQEVRARYGMNKSAYIPPPFNQTMEIQEEAPQPQQGMQSPMVDTQQLKQAIMQAMQEGVDPNQFMQSLVSRGVPPETIQQVMGEIQNEAQPPMSGQPQQPPMSGQYLSQEEVMGLIGEAEQKGVDPMQFIQQLESSGRVEPTMLAQLKASVEEPESEPETVTPSLSIRESIDKELAEEQRKLREMRKTPEERLLKLEKTVDHLINLLEGMTKQSSDWDYYNTILRSDY